MKTKIFHGMSSLPEYKTWAAIIQRCHNPNDKSFARYGARGTSVHEPWRDDFAAFYRHIGPKPSPLHSVDRYPNARGNYEPGNVRWATQIEQNNNRTNNFHITWRGETKTVAEWARELDVEKNTLRKRFRAGWDLDRCMTAPVTPKIGALLRGRGQGWFGPKPAGWQSSGGRS